MARAQIPFSVYPKRRSYPSGKRTTVYYYSLNPDCGPLAGGLRAGAAEVYGEAPKVPMRSSGS